MNKFKILLLILAMITLFTACGTTEQTQETPAQAEQGAEAVQGEQAGQEAAVAAEPLDITGLSNYEIYALASQALDNASSMKLSGTSSVKTDIGGVDTDMEVAMFLEVVKHSDTELDLRMSQIITSMDTPLTESFYRNGYLYTEAMGMKMKIAVPLEDMLEQLSMNGTLDFPEEAVISAEFKEVAVGSELSFLLSGEVMNGLVDSLLGGFSTMLPNVEMSIDLSDVTYVVTLGENNMPLTMHMDMSMTMEADGEAMSMDMVTFFSVDQIGGVVIDFPEGLDEEYAAVGF